MTNCLKLRIDFKQLLFYFILIDVLFFPYFTMISVSYSVPIVVLWMIINYKQFVFSREMIQVVLLLILMAISTLINPIYPWKILYDTSFFTAIKRFVQYSVLLILLIDFQIGFKKYKIDINRILFAFVLYVFAFAIVHFIFPNQYANVKLVFHPVDNHTIRYLQGLVSYRFNYFWTDPNNVAYAIAGVCTYLLCKAHFSATKKIIVIICSLFIIFESSSSGGIISLFLGILLIVIFKLLYGHPLVIRLKRWTVFSLLIFVIMLAITITQTNMIDDVVIPQISRFQDRMLYYQSSSDITGGRGRDFTRALLFMHPVMFLIGSGHEGIAREIGHLYVIGLYGGIAYILFMILMFGKYGNQKIYDYIWILPFFIGFTMNIAIGEYKWLAIYILILSYRRYDTSSTNGVKKIYNIISN